MSTIVEKTSNERIVSRLSSPIIMFFFSKSSMHRFPFDCTGATVTFLVGSQSFEVPKCYLMAISPVFHQMFSTEMKENFENVIKLDESIQPKDFQEMLNAISPKPILPNREYLQYQVGWHKFAWPSYQMVKIISSRRKKIKEQNYSKLNLHKFYST